MTNHQRGSITLAEKSSFLQLEPNEPGMNGAVSVLLHLSRSARRFHTDVSECLHHDKKKTTTLKENGELASSFYTGLLKVSKQLNAELGWPLDEQALHAAPGIDGLLVEFCKAFWVELGADWLAVLNETSVEGSLNWRLVNLLCTDLKVFSKVPRACHSFRPDLLCTWQDQYR
ncbi:hypothetical protein SRHO_G00175350 [Serrasalmus rhombeus]